MSVSPNGERLQKSRVASATITTKALEFTVTS
jgi:hypothetical protein